MKYLIAGFIILLTYSCKDVKNTETNETKTENNEDLKKIKDDIFRVILKVIAPEKDNFEIFYTDLYPDEEFREEKKNNIALEGSNEVQDIVFNLPKGILPYNFRIDLGNNKFQEKIFIKSIELKYNSNSIFIENDLIPTFFVVNEFINYDKSSGTAILSYVNNRRDPFIIAKPILIQKIEIEL